MGGCYAIHRIPPAADELRHKQWIHNMRRDIRNIDVECIRLCSTICDVISVLLTLNVFACVQQYAT